MFYPRPLQQTVPQYVGLDVYLTCMRFRPARARWCKKLCSCAAPFVFSSEAPCQASFRPLPSGPQVARIKIVKLGMVYYCFTNISIRSFFSFWVLLRIISADMATQDQSLRSCAPSIRWSTATRDGNLNKWLGEESWFEQLHKLRNRQLASGCKLLQVWTWDPRFPRFVNLTTPRQPHVLFILWRWFPQWKAGIILNRMDVLGSWGETLVFWTTSADSRCCLGFSKKPLGGSEREALGESGCPNGGCHQKWGQLFWRLGMARWCFSGLEMTIALKGSCPGSGPSHADFNVYHHLANARRSYSRWILLEPAWLWMDQGTSCETSEQYDGVKIWMSTFDVRICAFSSFHFQQVGGATVHPGKLQVVPLDGASWRSGAAVHQKASGRWPQENTARCTIYICTN